jgi:hypothetical protein
MSLPTRIHVGVSARSRSAVCTPLCAFKVVSKPTSKTTKTAKTSFTTKQTKTKQRSVPATEATVSPAQYLGLTGFSALAGTALTLAPQTFWELLGSRDIVDVTIESSEVGAHCNCTSVVCSKCDLLPLQAELRLMSVLPALLRCLQPFWALCTAMGAASSKSAKTLEHSAHLHLPNLCVPPSAVPCRCMASTG